MVIDSKEIGEEIANEYLRPIEEAIEKQGLTPTYLAKKLKYELDYIEPRAGKKGKLKAGPKAMRIRQTARQDAHKLRGDYAAEKHEHSGSTIIIMKPDTIKKPEDSGKGENGTSG